MISTRNRMKYHEVINNWHLMAQMKKLLRQAVHAPNMKAFKICKLLVGLSGNSVCILCEILPQPHNAKWTLLLLLSSLQRNWPSFLRICKAAYCFFIRDCCSSHWLATLWIFNLQQCNQACQLLASERIKRQSLLQSTTRPMALAWVKWIWIWSKILKFDQRHMHHQCPQYRTRSR